jgi:hypothetical protein
MEVGQAVGCVTAEVQLNKNIDFTQSIVVYHEVARALQPPRYPKPGIRTLLDACIERVGEKGQQDGMDPVELWIAGLEEVAFESEAFADVLRTALVARIRQDEGVFAAACRWLGGEVDNRDVAKQLGRSVVAKNSLNQHAHCSLLSLFQLIRYAGFRGTVLCFDEAEQGLATDRKKKDRILSMLRSEVDAVADLRGGSALIVYAVTPDLMTDMVMDYPALQQRVADPNDVGFFDGEDLAPRIDLAKRRKEPLKELEAISESLVELVYRDDKYRPALPREEALARAMEISRVVFENEPSVKGRREVAKNTAALLRQLVTGSEVPLAESAELEV